MGEHVGTNYVVRVGKETYTGIAHGTRKVGVNRISGVSVRHAEHYEETIRTGHKDSKQVRSVRWRNYSPEEMALYLVHHGKFDKVRDLETFIIGFKCNITIFR